MALTLTPEDLAAIAALLDERMPKKRKKPAEFATEDDLTAAGVSERHAREWLAIRKSKSLPLTWTAWEQVLEQAKQAGKTPAEALRISCAQGWAGFRASWLAKLADEPAATQAPVVSPQVEKTREYLAAQVMSDEDTPLVQSPSTPLMGIVWKMLAARSRPAESKEVQPAP